MVQKQVSTGTKQASGRTEQGQFAPGTSGNLAGRAGKGGSEHATPKDGLRVDALPAELQEIIATLRTDGWQSSITGIGTALKDKRTTAEFIVEPVSDVEAKAIYRGDDMGARFVDIVPHHMLREAFELVIGDAAPKKEEDELESAKPMSRQDARARKRRADSAAAKAQDLSVRAMKRWKALGGKDKFREALQWSRAYGGAAILVGAIDGSASWAKPLNEDKVRSVEFLTTLEAKDLVPHTMYADPMKPKFGEVAQWQISTALPGTPYEATSPKTIIVHESRLIYFPGIRVSRDQSDLRAGHGDSIFTRVKGVLRDFNIGWDAASIILHEFSLATMKIKGLADMVSTDAMKKLLARMAAVQLGRSVANVTLIDADEEYTRDMATVSGLAELLEKFMVRLAAAFNVPVVILMGVSPAGLNATGASDIRSFYDRIAADQVDVLEPPLRRLFGLILRTLNGNKEPDQWEIEFKPLWQETPKEQAETRKIVIDTAVQAIGAGVYTADEARRSHFGGEKFSAEIVIDDENDSILDTMPTDVDALEAKIGPDGKPLPLDHAKPVLGPDGKPAPIDPNAPATGAPEKGGEVTIVPTEKPVSNSALNGAQFAGMLAIVTAYTSKTIDRLSAKTQLLVSLPIDDATAEAMLGSETFVAATPAPAAGAFGGGAPGEDGEKPAPGEKPELGAKPPAAPMKKAPVVVPPKKAP